MIKVTKRDDDWQTKVRGRAGEKLTVYLRGTNALPYRITTSAEAGDTDVRFDEVRMNSGLKAEDMELRLPADVDIVEMAGLSH